MKRLKKVWALLLCVIMTGMLMAGCGDEKDAGAVPETPTVSTEEQISALAADLGDLKTGSVSGSITLGGENLKALAQTYLGSDAFKLQYQVVSSGDNSGKLSLSLDLKGTPAEALEVIWANGTVYVNTTKLIDALTAVMETIDPTAAGQYGAMKGLVGNDYLSFTKEDLQDLLGDNLDAMQDLLEQYQGDQLPSMLGNIEGFENVTQEDILAWASLALDVGGEKVVNALGSMLTVQEKSVKVHIGADNADTLKNDLTAFMKNELPGLIDTYMTRLKEQKGENDALYQYLQKNGEDLKQKCAEAGASDGEAAEEMDNTNLDLSFGVTGEKGNRVVALSMDMTAQTVTTAFTMEVKEGQTETVSAPEKATALKDLLGMFSQIGDAFGDALEDGSLDDVFSNAGDTV